MPVFRTALHIGACQYGLCGGLRTVFGGVVPAGQEVADGSAVGGDQSVEAPFVAQDLLLVACLCAAGLTVDALVGTHDFGHLSLLHQGLEGRQIGLPEVALGQILDVERVAVPLRTAVYGEVLGAGEELAVGCTQRLAIIGVALQAANDGQAHLRRQVGVFAVGLLTAPPAGITEDVDVRRPEGKTLIALDVARAFRLLGLDAGLVADGRKHPVEQGIVPRGGHRHRDGEDGRVAVAPDTVQGLAPPVEYGYAQSRDGRRRVHHQAHLLFERQSAQQIVGPLGRRQIRILVG